MRGIWMAIVAGLLVVGACGRAAEAEEDDAKYAVSPEGRAWVACRGFLKQAGAKPAKGYNDFSPLLDGGFRFSAYAADAAGASFYSRCKVREAGAGWELIELRMRGSGVRRLPEGTLSPGATPSVDTLNYRVSYMQCSTVPAEIYQQAGTRDPDAAARWLSDGLTPGRAWDAGYQGCLDALRGEPNRYP